MIIFESEIYAKNAKGVLPFKIVVEQNSNNGKNEVVVTKIEYNKVGDTEYANTRILSGTVWKDIFSSEASEDAKPR